MILMRRSNITLYMKQNGNYYSQFTLPFRAFYFKPLNINLAVKFYKVYIVGVVYLFIYLLSFI